MRRFALHHVPAAPRRRFWLRVALALALLAAPVAVFNLLVDPFDFRLVPHLKLPRENVIRKNDTALWVAGELRRLPQRALDEVTIAVVGDSRTDTICRWPLSPRIYRLGADRVINLSIGGATFGESLELLEAELPRLPKLRAVLLSAPVERVASSERDRVEKALRFAKYPFLYALGLGTTAQSAELWANRKIAPLPERPDIDPEHLLDVSAEGLNLPGLIARTDKLTSTPLPRSEKIAVENWRSVILAVDPEDIRQRTREVLVPLVKRLRERGVEVVFFFPPLHPLVREGIEAKIAGLQDPYVAELSRLGVVEDYSRGNRGGIKAVFADAMHVQQDVGHAVMADIYLRDFAKPPVSR